MSKMKWKAEQTENPLLSNEKLRGCALEAFSSQTYNEVSLNDILKQSGINKGSFYYRYFDKIDLYLSLISCLIDEKISLFLEYDRGKASADIFEDIRNKALLGLQFTRKHPQYNAMWKKLISEDASIRSLISMEFGDISVNVLITMVDSAKKSGQIRDCASSEMIAGVLAAFLEGIDKLIKPDSTDEYILSELDRLLDLLKYGVCDAKIS